MRILWLLAITCGVAAAQTFSEPPPVVRLIRTPTPDPAVTTRYSSGAAMAVIGLSGITGSAEWWLVEWHSSFAAVEQTDRALRPLGVLRGVAGEPLMDGTAPAATTWLAVHRPWLSYRPNEAIQMLGKSTYFQALIFRVDPTAVPDFVEAARARKLSLDGMNLDRPEMAYEVISGAPTVTYVFLAPLVSLTSFDEVLAHVPQYARAATKAAAAGNLSHQNLLFRVEPRLSLVPDDVAARAPEFWRPGAPR